MNPMQNLDPTLLGCYPQLKYIWISRLMPICIKVAYQPKKGWIAMH